MQGKQAVSFDGGKVMGGQGQRKGQKEIGFKVMSLLALVLVLDNIAETSGSGLDSTNFVLGPNRRPLTKRSFFDIQCKGVYNKDMFAKLDRVCDDCFNLYQETQLHALCRSNCFGSSYFKGCVDALLLNDEESKFDEMIEILGKK